MPEKGLLPQGGTYCNPIEGRVTSSSYHPDPGFRPAGRLPTAASLLTGTWGDDDHRQSWRHCTILGTVGVQTGNLCSPASTKDVKSGDHISHTMSARPRRKGKPTSKAAAAPKKR